MKSIIICILSFSLTISTSCDFSTNNENNEIEGKDGVILYYNRAAQYSDAKLMLLDIETERTKMVTDSADGFARWSPDGKRIAYMGPSMYEGSSQIYVVNVDGSGKRIVTLWEHQGKLEQHADGGEIPVWSPDGQRIAFSRCINCEAFGGNWEIFIVYLDTTGGLKEVRLTNNPYSDGISDWSPDGQKILFQSDFALDGSYDAYGDWYTMNIDGSDKQRILTYDSTFGAHGLRYSPDGQKIAYIAGSNNSEIYIMDADGSNIKKVTNNGRSEAHVSWSPDGTRLAFATSRLLFLINTDGTSLRHLPKGQQPEWRPEVK